MSDRGPLLANATLFELSPDQVDEGDRIGFLHEDKAAALGRLMAVDGQRDPIKVVANSGGDRPWRLVTGMHRLIGARIECMTVFAIEVSGKPEDLADLEASENLHRRPLAPIERAKFTAALVQAAQQRVARTMGNLTHQQRGIKKRWDSVKSGAVRAEEALRDEVEDTHATIAQVYGWEESVSEALGMSRRTIHYDLTVFRLIIEPFPDLIEPLARHPVVGENGKQLREIADIVDEGQRRLVIERLLADGGHELSAQGAKDLIGIGIRDGSNAPRRPLEKYRNQIKNGWGHLSLSDRRSFIPDLAAMLEQPSLKVEMHALLTAEIAALRASGRLGGGDE